MAARDQTNRSLLIGSAVAFAAGIGAGWAAVKVFRRSEKETPRHLSVPPRPEARPHAADREPSIERETARKLLLYAVPAAWIAAGLADWMCHRATRIEDTAGAKESLIHLLMQAEFGVPVLLTLFCEITPPVIASEIAAFILHEGTVYWDLTYTSPRRDIAPFEQQVHAWLELVPLVAIALIAVLHWPEAKALFGFRDGSLDLSLRRRDEPLPLWYRAGLLLSVALFDALPYLEELWRCLRANDGQLVSNARA